MQWHLQRLALVGLFSCAIVLAVLAGPHAMYFAPAAALGALLAGSAYAGARSGMPRWLAATLLIVSLVPAIPGVLRYGRLLSRGLHPRNWTGVQSHRSAVWIAQMLAQYGGSGPVATLFPIVAMDVNQVYPEFAAGPFFFRSADAYSADRVAELRGVGPATIEKLFAAAPPAAIVAGFGPFRFNWKPPMDAALLDYARRSGYRRVPHGLTNNGYGNGEVWVRPAAP